MGKIYTKKGDLGNTCTINSKTSKGDVVPEALGSIDELNSFLGVVRSEFKINNLEFTILEKEIKRMQGNLMAIASEIAGSGSEKIQKDFEVETESLEKLIDRLTDELPKLTNFIYPVGTLQLARAVARRCERNIVKMYSGKFTIYNEKQKMGILKYINRLSDVLFVMGRWVNYKNGNEEEVWSG